MCPLLLLLYLSGVKRMQRYGFIFALRTTDIKRLRQLVNFKMTIHFLLAIRDKKQKPTALPVPDSDVRILSIGYAARVVSQYQQFLHWNIRSML